MKVLSNGQQFLPSLAADSIFKCLFHYKINVIIETVGRWERCPLTPHPHGSVHSPAARSTNSHSFQPSPSSGLVHRQRELPLQESHSLTGGSHILPGLRAAHKGHPGPRTLARSLCAYSEVQLPPAPARLLHAPAVADPKRMHDDLPAHEPLLL